MQNFQFSNSHLGGKNSRGIRVSSYDPDEPSATHHGNSNNTGGNSGTVSSLGNASQGTPGGSIASCIASKTLGNQRKFMPGGQRVATISQNYNEKTMLLSSDDEYQ